MKATHTCYKHPRHLRVVTGQAHPAWNIVQGDHEADALCVSPSAEIYRKLNRASMPCHVRENGGRCHIHGKD